MMPSRGQGITAGQRPISDYDRKRGDRIGYHWWVPKPKGRRLLRHLSIDTNFWKSFILARLSTAMGDPGCLSLYGHAKREHDLFSEHLTSEFYVRTSAQGRTVDEWKLKPGRTENHWFDCLVACAAAASMEGASLPGLDTGGTGRRRRRVSVAELKARTST